METPTLKTPDEELKYLSGMLCATPASDTNRLRSIAQRVTEIASSTSNTCKDCGKQITPWGGSDIVCVNCGLWNLATHCDDPGDAAFFQKMAGSIDYSKEHWTKSAQEMLSPSAIAQTAQPKEWEMIQELMGYVEDGSSQTVTLYQDDATKNYTVKVDSKSYWGHTLKEALTKALA
jgi:hypothetical protein